jgi:hypothetical protein
MDGCLTTISTVSPVWFDQVSKTYEPIKGIANLRRLLLKGWLKRKIGLNIHLHEEF